MQENTTRLIGIAYTRLPYDEDIKRMRDIIFTEEDLELLSSLKPEMEYL